MVVWVGMGLAGAQTPTAPAPASGAAATPAAATPPLKLRGIDQPAAAPVDPFPAVNPKFFTAQTPTVDTVNAFLHAIWGYDPARIWRVEAILSTPAPGVSKVIVFVTDKSPNAKVQNTAFFVTPDGKHAVAGDGVVSFGPTPFAATRELLEEKADGPATGPASKKFLLVEFADLQCPHCKEAQGTMEQLTKDFPDARIVYQSFPLVTVHPFAFKAAAYGVCVSKQKPEAYFPYAAAVYNTQEALTAETGDQTLKAAVTKAGLDPATVEACAATPATKAQVEASMKLAEDAGVDQTPMLAVDGHMLPMSSIPYETLKHIIAFQAQMDGVGGGSAGAAPVRSGPPTLGKR